jgi:serine protease AprX
MAFIDAGFSNHPDLSGRILAHVDASTAEIRVQPEVTHTTPASWHGQMTSVIAAGDGHNSGGVYRGLASQSRLVLVKVSTPQLRVKEIDIMRGLNWLLGHHAQYGVQIVNISVGGDFVSDDPAHPLHTAVRDLVEQGVVVVIAAGNRTIDTLVPPASAPEAITVGGYSDENTFDRRHWHGYGNSYGTAYDGTAKPELVAPARWIASPILPDSNAEREIAWLAPLLRGYDGTALQRLLHEGREALHIAPDAEADTDLYTLLQDRIDYHKIINESYQHVDGTSVAAPIVASVIAQMLEVNPRLTPLEIKRILTETAQPLPHIAPARQGAGGVNAADAVAMAAAYLENQSMINEQSIEGAR